MHMQGRFRAMPLLVALTCGVACMSLGLASACAAFPSLEAAQAFAGKVEAGGTVYDVLLRLRPGRFFILHERALLPSGRLEKRSLTGRWRQSDGGALLRLTSRNGFDRTLNVGGGQELYGHVRTEDGQSLNLPLKLCRDDPRPFSLAGLLDFEDGMPRLQDAASGIVFPLKSIDPADVAALDALARRNVPLFAEAEVEESLGGVRLLRLLSVSERLPSTVRQAPRLLREVRGGSWRWLTDKAPDLNAVFTPQGESEALLELTGKGLRVRALCQSHGDDVSFHVDEADAAMLRGAGFASLLETLLGIRSWNFEAEAIVFSQDDRILAVLERHPAR